jgi:hypothetical protein
MNISTGTPLHAAHAKYWRAMGTEPLTDIQLARVFQLEHAKTDTVLAEMSADHLAFELPSQPGRWRRQWPRFVCLPDAAEPLPQYTSFGTNPHIALDRWGNDHLPQLAAEGMVDTHDGIAVAVYHTEPLTTWTSDMPPHQIGVVGSLERREVLLWEGCSYCHGTELDPDNLQAEALSCPACCTAMEAV